MRGGMVRGGRRRGCEPTVGEVVQGVKVVEAGSVGSRECRDLNCLIGGLGCQAIDQLPEGAGMAQRMQAQHAGAEERGHRGIGGYGGCQKVGGGNDGDESDGGRMVLCDGRGWENSSLSPLPSEDICRYPLASVGFVTSR